MYMYVSKIFVWYLWSGTCTPSPFLKNEIDKCVGYGKKNNSKTKLRKIGASLCTHALSIKSNANFSIFSHNYQRILFNQLIYLYKKFLKCYWMKKNVQFKESKQGLIFWIAWICSRTVVCPYTSLQLKYWANL